MTTYSCNGASIEAASREAAALAFANLAAFDAFGEAGFCSSRFLVEIRRGRYQAFIGRGVAQEGRIVFLEVEEQKLHS